MFKICCGLTTSLWFSPVWPGGICTVGNCLMDIKPLSTIKPCTVCDFAKCTAQVAPIDRPNITRLAWRSPRPAKCISTNRHLGDLTCLNCPTKGISWSQKLGRIDGYDWKWGITWYNGIPQNGFWIIGKKMISCPILGYSVLYSDEPDAK